MAFLWEELWQGRLQVSQSLGRERDGPAPQERAVGRALARPGLDAELCGMRAGGSSLASEARSLELCWPLEGVSSHTHPQRSHCALLGCSR